MDAPCARGLTLRRQHELEQLVAVPCEFLSFHADAAEKRLVETEDVDDDMPEHHDVLGDVVRPRARPVLVEVQVERPVHRLGLWPPRGRVVTWRIIFDIISSPLKIS